MGAIILSLVATFIFTAVLWLTLGSKLRLSSDDALNDRKNLAAYFGMLFPAIFLTVFFLMERL